MLIFEIASCRPSLPRPASQRGSSSGGSGGKWENGKWKTGVVSGGKGGGGLAKAGGGGGSNKPGSGGGGGGTGRAALRPNNMTRINCSIHCQKAVGPPVLSCFRSGHLLISILLAFYNPQLSQKSGFDIHTIKVCVSSYQRSAGALDKGVA